MSTATRRAPIDGLAMVRRERVLRMIATQLMRRFGLTIASLPLDSKARI